MSIHGSTSAARALRLLALLTASLASALLPAQTPAYARANSFGLFVAYSPDSSHILMGVSENRQILNVGVSYNRRLIARRFVNWQYSGEFMPVALESDPVARVVVSQTSPTQSTYSYNEQTATSCAPVTEPYAEYLLDGTLYSSGSFTVACHGRQWTYGEAISPLGFQWNFLPRHKMQPFFVAHGGTMFTTHPIPVSNAGSFNFAFDFGAGIELYRSKNRSIRAEYRFHHISNASTAGNNPGIDNGLYQVTYCFGR